MLHSSDTHLFLSFSRLVLVLITMLVTYWFGCWWLPSFLCYLDFDAAKLGNEVETHYTDEKMPESSEEEQE